MMHALELKRLLECKDCMKKFFESLRNHAMEINNFKNKEK